MKRASENDIAAGKKFKPVEISQDLGTILSVTLQNFMCHDHLKFDFDPHINFIIGQNGSGKSAILTGIILALGGKSSVTGRYSNIKGFVKTGKNKARISITLKNCGPSAYKKEIYGDKIIVEREISIEGSSSYKLKTAEGKIASTLKEELNNILIAMDIQIDNPVLVLTQETSRSFLMAKTGKAEKLFEFFYKGTGLQKLEENYQLSVATSEDCARDLTAKKKALDCVEKEVKRLEKLRKSDEKIDELKREAFWARVIAMEKELEERKNEHDELVGQIAQIKQEVEKSKNEHDKESQLVEKADKDRTEIQEKIVAERNALEENSRISEMCADHVRNCKGQVELYKRVEKELLKDIQNNQEAINEHQMRDQTDYENERRNRNEQILDIEEQISNKNNQKAEFEKRYNDILQLQDSKNQELNMLQSEINELLYKKNLRLNEYKQLTNSRQNRQFLFGEHTPQVLQDIELNRHKFIKMPRGPIGLDIEVKDPKWNCAVEACIKPNMLRSFCVDNSKDSMLLTQILQKYYADRMPSVIVSPFLPHMHDVSRHKAQTNIPTVLDMLSIKDPVIANCLIDQNSIENIILIEDITTANHIMLDNPPRQCYSAFLQNCDEILLNPYRFYSASRKSTNVFSKTVDERDLENLKHKIDALGTQIEAKNSEMRDVRFQLQNYPTELDNLASEIGNIISFVTGALSRIEELRQFEEPRNVPELHDEFLTLNTELQKKQGELRIAEEKLAGLELECQNARQKFRHQKEICNRLRHEYETLGNTINQSTRNKEYLESRKKKFEAELKADERKLRQLENEIQRDDNKVKELITERKKVDKKPRIQTKRSYEDIDVQITEMQRVIAEQSNSTDKASLLEKYNEKSKKLIEAKYEYIEIERQNVRISKMMKTRSDRFKQIITHTQLAVDLSFTVFLRGNGFSGSLKFSGNHTLELRATPNKKSSETGRKNTCSSLSGGERSFVTIAFLLALWEKIDMPFRILDEYDVFMDTSNRHLSISLLIKQAARMSGVQFIFLSPLDLPELNNTNKNITVHKMPPPQRIGLSNMEE